MKKILLALLIFPLMGTTQIDTTKQQHKGLLWEITGNGLKEKSYLYGTMHVSGRIAFHLGEEFFDGLKSVDAIALESNPIIWLDEIMESKYADSYLGGYSIKRQTYKGFYKKAFELSIPKDEIETEEIFLIGHSRGGSVSILKACEDDRVKKVVSWAAVPDLASFLSIDQVSVWTEKGVHYVRNGRTHQDMPMYYQLVEDFLSNQSRFDIGAQLKHLKIPFMAIHGDADETVPVESLQLFKSYYPSLNTHGIKDATHTFGGKHPWESEDLPTHAVELVAETVAFLKS